MLLRKRISPFEIKPFGDPICCFLGTRFFTCSSSYLSSSENELDAFIREGQPVDPLCLTSSLEIEFVYLLIQMWDLFMLNVGWICVLHRSYPSASGFQELDSSRGFRVVLGRLNWLERKLVGFQVWASRSGLCPIRRNSACGDLVLIEMPTRRLFGLDIYRSWDGKLGSTWEILGGSIVFVARAAISIVTAHIL